jgi:hypothetical protein
MIPLTEHHSGDVAVMSLESILSRSIQCFLENRLFITILGTWMISMNSTARSDLSSSNKLLTMIWPFPTRKSPNEKSP